MVDVAPVMVQVRVKKVVVVCFLEAAKWALEQIGARRLEHSHQETRTSSECSRIYGDVRRLRDYLTRCVSGYQDEVDVDLGPSDTGLLVGCCRGAVDMIEQRLGERALANDEKQWLQKKLGILAEWALELGEKPLIELPIARPPAAPGEVTRNLTVKLQEKLFGDVTSRKKILAPGARIPPPTMNSMVTGVRSFAEECRAQVPNDTDPGDAAEQPTLPSAASFSLGLVAPERLYADVDTRNPVPQLFDYHRLRDPRLRALVGIDSQAYERCVHAEDYRLATILMASILEAAVLDHVVPRRAEFNLTGAPDSWNPSEVLMTALGERATPKDRSLSFHLFAARNLLRPAVQMTSPTVVTSSSFERLREFVQRALHGLGFGVPTTHASASILNLHDLAEMADAVEAAEAAADAAGATIIASSPTPLAPPGPAAASGDPSS
jgi:hypothetical protein